MEGKECIGCPKKDVYLDAERELLWKGNECGWYRVSQKMLYGTLNGIFWGGEIFIYWVSQKINFNGTPNVISCGGERYFISGITKKTTKVALRT